MKVECPVCHVLGVLQQRGNSSRVQHYVSFKDGKRVYLYHKVEAMEVNDGSNGSKSMEVNKACNSALLVNVAPPIGLEPMTDWLTASRSTWLSYGGSCVTLSFDFLVLFKSSHSRSS